MIMPYAQNFKYVRHLIQYAFRRNRLLYIFVVSSFVSVVCELLAMSSLLPLSTLASGAVISPQSKTYRALAFFHVEANLKTLILIFLGMFSLRICTNLFSQAIAFKVGKRMQAQMSSEAFDLILKDFPIKEIEAKSIGYFISMAGDEVNRASQIIVNLCQVVSWLFLCVLYYGTILVFSWRVGLAVIIFLLISFLCLFSAFRKSHRLGLLQFQQGRAASSLFIDALNGLRSVRAFSAEDYVSKNYEGQIFKYVQTLFLIDFLHILAKSIPVLILFAALAIGLGLTPANLWSQISVGWIVTLILFMMRFFPAVGSCLNTALRIASDVKAGQDITELLRSGGRLKKARTNAGRLSSVQTIHMQDVGFAHEASKPVLRDVNLSFEKGKSYAIVGESGAGKSTLFDLLLKFYPLQGGSIQLGSEKLSDLTEQQVRSQILLLGQQTTILDDTVSNNIRYGFEASAAQVEEAAKLACIHELVSEMPDRYETRLQYQGTNLSGGQRQRIGLARAFLREPDVLILDESTGSLDPVTRDQIIVSLLRHYGERILIFITHDADVCEKVDHVYRLEKT